MAPMWLCCRLGPILWGLNQGTTSQISATMISWSWLLISSQWSITCRKTYTSLRRLCLVSKWTMRRLMSVKKIICCFGRSTRTTSNINIAVDPIREGDKWRWGIYHHKSGGQTASLHTYHIKVEIVVPVWRNNATNEVAQGRDTW
jgi:hypothetical protein